MATYIDDDNLPDHAPTTRKMLYGAILSIVAMPAFITLIMVTVAYKESIDDFCNDVVMFLADRPFVTFTLFLFSVATVIGMIIKSAKRG